MVSHFEPAAGVDAVIARRYGQPAIRRVLRMLTEEAQKRAPSTRVWVTVRDERVRRTHVETDTQVVPDNLRFKIPSVDGTGFDLGRHPRDPDLPVAQSINCRCEDPPLPELLRETIHATDVEINGNRVSGSVETKFPRAAESENGTDKDKAAHFMLGALMEVSARLRAGQ